MNSRLRLSLLALPLLLAACTSTDQSAFHPTGADAARINTLFWVMTIGGAAILVWVCVATALAIFGNDRQRARFGGENVITIFGIAMPVVVLTILLAYGFIVLRAGGHNGSDVPADTDIAVSGELWWWRVTYVAPDGTEVESANEIHVPVGEPVRLALTSADVIHSFWAPRLGGKLDMIPGRTNFLTVEATEPGVSRGQCAEYCGGAHAFMSFHVVAHPPGEYEAWLESEAAPAREPETDAERQGEQLFIEAGCGACHTVRGTEANGKIGPDLTHVGSRRSLGAATLPNTAEDFARWIVDSQHIKPENKMPEYDIFSETELASLATYLEGLK